MAAFRRWRSTRSAANRSPLAACASCRCRSGTAACRSSASVSGTFAYLTDCNRIPDESWPLLDGVDTLVIDALRDEPHTTHFTVAEALEAIERIAPRRAYLTHMTHDLGHAATNARLPAGVELAYDGLRLDVAVDVEGRERGGGEVIYTE